LKSGNSEEGVYPEQPTYRIGELTAAGACPVSPDIDATSQVVCIAKNDETNKKDGNYAE